MVADIGGTTVEDSVRRMMGSIMGHTLSLEYNVTGQKNKKRFLGLQLFDVVYGKFSFLSGGKPLLREAVRVSIVTFPQRFAVAMFFPQCFAIAICVCVCV